MAKNKPPKKKYTPRPVYFPQLINSMLYFDPIVRALDALAKREEMRVDDHGTYVIDNGAGELLAFHEAMDVFVRYVEVFFHRMQKPAPFLNHIKAFQEIAKAKLPFDYENVLTVQRLMIQYKEVMAKIPPQVSRDILKTVKTQLAMDRLGISEDKSPETPAFSAAAVATRELLKQTKPDAGELLTKAATQFQETNDRLLERNGNTMIIERVIPADAVSPELLAKAKETYANIVEDAMIDLCRAHGTVDQKKKD